jgi:hypothetical protein
MTPRTPQCEVFWSSKSSSEFLRVPEDSNPNFFQVLGFTPTLGQSRVATEQIYGLTINHSPTPLLKKNKMWVLDVEEIESSSKIDLKDVL